MRITYVARSFLDYRIPVLTELDRLCGSELQYVSSTKLTPPRVLDRLREVIGERAIYLTGERSLGVDRPVESNTSFCIPYQPGLLRTIARTKPDVVVGDGFFQWTYAALLHRILRGTPLVICYERWAHTERNAQWYRRLYRRIVLKATSVMNCNGKLSAEYVCSLGFPRGMTTTGHMAADTDRLARSAEAVTANARAELRASWQARGVVFLCVGRLIKIKGLRELINGWALFERSPGNDATLIVVGNGPEESNLKEQARRLTLRTVRFAGAIEYDHIAPYYAAADALIMSGLEDNWSLVVPEAMACGLPIVCSKYNGCWPELVQEGRNGWVFDPLCLPDMLRCLEDCQAKATALRQMGKQSQQIVETYTPKRAAEAIHHSCCLALTKGQAEVH